MSLIRIARGHGRALAMLAVAAGLALASLALPQEASAGVAPNLGRKVSLVAREQQLPAFLNDLFSQIDVPVAVSQSASGVVNGRFSGTADSVFREIARSFSLVGYHDGAVMHIASASEIGTRTYGIDPAQASRVLRSAEDLGLTDPRNTLRTTRSGTLVALGAPRFLQQVDDLVRAEFSVPAPRVAAPATVSTAAASASMPPGTIGFRVFYLRHAWAQDTRVAFGGRQLVVPGVATVLRNVTAGLGQTLVQPMLPGQGGPGSAQAEGETLLRPSQPRLRGKGLADIGRMPTLGQNGQGGDGGDGGAERAVVERGADRNALGAAAAVGPGSRYLVSQVGGAHVEADPRSNAVIVRDVVERLPMYEQLIAALDFEPQMVEVEATIVDVNISRLQEMGINWRWINGRNDVLFGRGNDSDARLAAGQQITPTGLGMYVSTVLGSGYNFISRINALASDGAARVVSRPQLITLSNVEALFDNNSTFYVRVAGRQEVDLFNVSAGTSLRVTPNVFRDREGWRIKLLVSVEDGSISKQQVDQIPVVDRSTINTQALIQEGESLLIGGMTRESSERATDRVPVLGDVPVLGNLFRNRSETTQRFERLILITPRLVQSSRVQAAAAAFTGSAAGAAGTGTVPAAGATPAPRAPVPAPAMPASVAPAPAAARGDSRVDSTYRHVWPGSRPATGASGCRDATGAPC
ncbi:MAG: type III secretion system outer membrane ring subunit SctC [Burkholderiales bacterium]